MDKKKTETISKKERFNRVKRVCLESSGGLLKRLDENRAFNDFMRTEMVKYPEIHSKCSFSSIWIRCHDHALVTLVHAMGIKNLITDKALKKSILKGFYPRPWTNNEREDYDWNESSKLLMHSKKERTYSSKYRFFKVRKAIKTWTRWGLLKRIDENREFMQLFHYYKIDSFPCIEEWTEKMDIFLVDLLNAIGEDIILADMGNYSQKPRPWVWRDISHLYMKF